MLHAHNTRKFDSLGHFNEALGELPARVIKNSNDSFYGENFNAARRLMLQGNVSLLSAADKMLNALQSVIFPAIGSPVDSPHYYGQRPNIGAIVAGQPKSMYRRRLEGSNIYHNSPITIYVSRGMSFTFTPTEVLNRGMACVGLALAMKRIRPVELWIADSNVENTYLVSIKLDIEAIDMPVLLNALTGVSMYRRLMFSIFGDIHNQEYQGSVPEANAELLRNKLNAVPTDIIIAGARHSERHLYPLLYTDPIGWVKARLIEQGATFND